MPSMTRREWLRQTAWQAAGAGLAVGAARGLGQVPGSRPAPADGIEVLNPRLRVPVSLIIDDSTCLVNLNRFAIPQFETAWGGRQEFHQRWRDWPAEIPDGFVRKFADFADEHGIKGKYSVVPFPACVGRVDRTLPGWSERALDESLALVRTRLMPNWDIHPEMITHTWVIDTKTGHPLPNRTLKAMENWDWSAGRSTDELGDYLAYALSILKNVGLPCEGVTTPGGFGSRVLPELARATLQACREVFATEVPHYFRHLFDRGPQSVTPRVEYASGLGGDDPRCVVSIIGCTGDWTGGWDCSDRGDVDRFITADLQRGRLVEVIERGEPAILVCHWTGIWFNGEEAGFKILQEVVRRLHERFDHLAWMKLSGIARYWAARELTRIDRAGGGITLHAPYACPDFTLRLVGRAPAGLRVESGTARVELREVTRRADLKPGTWLQEPEGPVVCFDLARGRSILI